MAWVRPKTGKPSGTHYDSLTLEEVIRKRDELSREVAHLKQTAQGTGLTADTARANFRTLNEQLNQVESAYEYLKAQNEKAGNKKPPGRKDLVPPRIKGRTPR